MGMIITFALYWLVFFVACYVVSDNGQKYLYDEATPALGLKVAGGTFLLAGLAAYYRPSFDTMFTSEIFGTILQAGAWFGVFLLVLGFHPPHAALLGIGTMVLFAGLASMGVDSLMASREGGTPRPTRVVNKPLRRQAISAPSAPTDGASKPADPAQAPLKMP